ncbi:MAG: ABC transporter ATP-binding protein [Oscillospiraceae bacterium]|nr:ABC transporter ATP-binding protein [Oscillospiraceae bacterium]
MKDRTAVMWIRKNTGNRNVEGAVLILLNALIAVCTTLFAVISKNVIDCAQKGDFELLKKQVLILLSAILIQMLARVSASFLEAVSQGRAEIELKTKVFSSILGGNFAKMNFYHSGELMTRLTADVSVVSEYSVHIVPAAVLNVVKLVSAAVTLLALDRQFAVVFIVCGIAVSVAALILRNPIKKLHRTVQEKDGKLRSFMQETIENLFAVKVFGIEEKMVQRSVKRQRKLYIAKLKRIGISIASQLGFSFAFALGFLAAVAYGANGILKGTMTFGTVTSLILLVNQLQSPISGITAVIPSFFSMVSSASRLAEITEEKTESKDFENIDYEDFEGIEAKALSFDYDGEPVIENADFKVDKGDFVGICGRSGAGKTTLFKLLTGLYEPISGSVFVKTSNGTKSADVLRSLISFVPQDNMLFSGTLRENITLLNKNATDEEIENALKIVCADEFVGALPLGLETQLSEDGGGISQGQAQRLAIARALLSGRRILLMDEATSSLDAETEKKFIENLKEINGITVLFITHRKEVLRNCSKVIEISGGEISIK